MASRWIVGPGCAFVLLSAGCSGASNEAPPAAPVDWHAFDRPHGPQTGPAGPTAKERAAAEGYVNDLASPDFGSLSARLEPLSRFAFPGLHPSHGRQDIVAAHRKLFDAFDNRAVTLSRVLRTDDEQTIEWTMTGVQARPWLGVPATNKPVVIKGVALVFTQDEGLVREIHLVFDIAAIKAQLGAGPKELAANPVPAVPTGAPQSVEQTHSLEETSNLAVARAPIDALGATDNPSEARYVTPFADNAEIDSAERTLKGRDELKAYYKAMRRSISQLGTTIDNAYAVGPFAVMSYSISGGQLGPIQWIPAQRDHTVEMDVVDIAEIRDGKIVHVWRYNNPSQILVADEDVKATASQANR